MHPDIAAALATVNSQAEEKRVRHEGIITLAFAMEKSNATLTPLNNLILYWNELPPSLFNHRLTENEQKEIAASLLQAFESGSYVETGVFWAIGKALPGVIVEYVAPFLEKHWATLTLNNSILHQALQALCYGLDEDDPQCLVLLRQGNLLSRLRAIIHSDFTQDRDVIYIAECALHGVERIVGDTHTH